MSCAVACDDQASPLRVKRKPAPPTAALVHQPPSLPSHSHSRPRHHLAQSVPKSSLSERYPDPDPTDPFAPLWVLRSRTTSVTQGSGPLAPEHLRQQADQFGSRLGRSDRRHSTPYLLQSFTPTSSTDGHETITRPGYTSEHGHAAGSIGPRSNSCSNGATGASVARQRLFKPTRLSQITALAIPSVSKSSRPASPVSPALTMHVTPISQQLQPIRVDVDGSGTDSDSTHVGPLEAVEMTSQRSMQPRPQPLGKTQEQERFKSGSVNKITRFLKTRRASQVDLRSQTTCAAAADINRIRKASISPPVTSSVVWASRGQAFVPIKDHPLHRAAIPIVAPTSDVADVRSSLQDEGPNAADMKTCSAAAETAMTIQPSVVQPTSALDVAAVLHSDAPVPLPLPPTLAKHHSQTSHGHTDESHSTFSFVHVPSTLSSSSLAHFTQENLYEAPASGRRPSTAPLHTVIGPGVCATIASSATMRIKRRSSLKIPLAHTAAPLSPLNSMSTAKPLSPILSDSEPSVGEWDIPTFQALSKAASLTVIAESGVRVNFGSLFLQQKAVVVFIRHFWCPLCQDYMSSITSLNRDLDDLLFGFEKDVSNEKAWGFSDDKERPLGGSLKLVIIGNGSYTMIGKYKQIFGAGAAGLEVYTDPSLAVYNALGMGRDPASLAVHREGGSRKRRGSTTLARLDVETLSGNTTQKGVSGGNDCRGTKDSSDGGYVKHGLMGGIAMVFMRALKVGMPVWEKGGDLHQLGGEFVLGPGLICAYAHRMQTTKGHAPFEDALHAAGVVTRPTPVRPVLQAKARDLREIDKNAKPRPSKPEHSSVSGKTYTAPKLRSRGQTIDVVPISAPVSEVPASASAPIAMSLSSGPARGLMGASRKRTGSLRDRKKSIRHSSDEAQIVNSGPGVHKAMEQIAIDCEQEWNPSVSAAPAPLSEPDWTENRHRSLRSIKERKNARRGLSSVDERQVISASISISRSHSRSVSPPGPHPSSFPMSQTGQSHHYERLKSRLNYESEFSEFGVASASDRKPPKGRSGKGSVDGERVVQSDTNVEMNTVKGRRGGGGGGGVTLARKMKVNLSREHHV